MSLTAEELQKVVVHEHKTRPIPMYPVQTATIHTETEEDDTNSFSERGRNTMQELVKRMQMRCIVFSQEHAVLAVYYEKISWLIGVPATICAAVVGSLAMMPVGSSKQDPTVALAIAIMGLLNVIFVSLINFFNFDKKSLAHKEASKQHRHLATDLETLRLTSPRMSSAVYTKTFKDLSTRKEEIYKSSPFLPISVLMYQEADSLGEALDNE